MILAAVLAIAGTATIAAGPPGDAFYVPPVRLPPGSDGTVIWARRFTGGAALPSAAINYLILYETTSASGRLVAVSGTLAIPRGEPPAQGWPLISWAHGTTGNGPQCAPSRSAEPNIEQRMLDGFVRRGYAVVQTDYEGNGTPGIHPYMVALSAARDVTAIVAAARTIDPQVGRAWVVMGHSEGGAAALATAALGQRLAPGLKLLGVVAYAPLAFTEEMLQNETRNGTPNDGLPIVVLMLQGLSTVDSRIVPSEILVPEVVHLMPELARWCLPDVQSSSQWANLVPQTIFRPQAESAIATFYNDLLINDPAYFPIAVPTLLVQGVADAVINPESTIEIADRYRRHGTPVSFKAYVGATHGSVLAAAASDVEAWLAQRFIVGV
ncbi:MAG TPA: alpha/beta fold hydrolase [Candidatus Cybelea sp.]|nr:alpha/beta fold hydrolase [Candidatus Cybelea sp.]